VVGVVPPLADDVVVPPVDDVSVDDPLLLDVVAAAIVDEVVDPAAFADVVDGAAGIVDEVVDPAAFADVVDDVPLACDDAVTVVGVPAARVVDVDGDDPPPDVAVTPVVEPAGAIVCELEDVVGLLLDVTVPPPPLVYTRRSSIEIAQF
jgi:hypothetical protein